MAIKDMKFVLTLPRWTGLWVSVLMGLSIAAVWTRLAAPERAEAWFKRRVEALVRRWARVRPA